MSKVKLLVSSCLLGKPCRYDAQSKASIKLLNLIKENLHSIEVIEACPEMLGNLGCPRNPCEIKSRSREVVSSSGENKTANYLTGAHKTLEICQSNGISTAVLKENSPSCGSQFIYDGTFSGKKIQGMGITTELLMHNGISVYNENQAEQAFQKVLENKE